MRWPAPLIMRFQMLWVRGIVFTVLVPGVVGFFLPSAVDPRARLPGGISNVGWLLVAAGMLTYALCLIRFLAAGGTSALAGSAEARPPSGVFAGLRGAIFLEHPCQKLPRFRLAVARHLHPDALMEKRIHILDQHGDLA